MKTPAQKMPTPWWVKRPLNDHELKKSISSERASKLRREARPMLIERLGREPTPAELDELVRMAQRLEWLKRAHKRAQLRRRHPEIGPVEAPVHRASDWDDSE